MFMILNLSHLHMLSPLSPKWWKDLYRNSHGLTLQ